jgi:hypothetical protein
MTSTTSNSAIRTRLVSWACALLALIFVFGVARLAMNRLPFIALLAVAGFKYASMFYVAGRLIEQMWRYASKAATGFLVGTRSGQLAAQRPERQPRKSLLRKQMRQLRHAHAVNGTDSEVSHG